jgi:malate dehydrogenase (oxaloacetate-decarboxylating)(NADP+)
MIDGEMHGDAALVESIRNERMPDSPLKSANILVMPNMEAARISYNLLRVSSSEGVTVGPVLMGVAKPVHIDADRLRAPHREYGGAGGG